MQCYNFTNLEGNPWIRVTTNGHGPRVVLGGGAKEEGSNSKRETWIYLLGDDAESIMFPDEDQEKYPDVRYITNAGVRHQPKSKDGTKPARYLITAPLNDGEDADRVLLVWRFPAGSDGNAAIEAGNSEASILAEDFHYAQIGDQRREVAEVLAILRPGGKLIAERDGEGIEGYNYEIYFDGVKDGNPDISIRCLDEAAEEA